MTYAIGFLVVLAFYLYHLSGGKLFFAGYKKGTPQEVAVEPAAQPSVPEEVPVAVAESEYIPDQLLVRHLNNGMATLLMRERSRLAKCTAHLIVWAGKRKRRKGQPSQTILVEDSHYDLGYQDGSELTEEVVDTFVKDAKAKLRELVVNGMRKRRTKPATAEASAAEVPIAEPQIDVEAGVVTIPAITEETSVTVEENDKPASGAAIKLKRYPSVFRGVVLSMGMMPKSGVGGDVDCYGVRYRTAEGVEDVVWGRNLHAAFQDAGAGIGDNVEILKIGRKAVEKGKAPMNLYVVTKLPAEPTAAH